MATENSDQEQGAVSLSVHSLLTEEQLGKLSASLLSNALINTEGVRGGIGSVIAIMMKKIQDTSPTEPADTAISIIEKVIASYLEGHFKEFRKKPKT